MGRQNEDAVIVVRLHHADPISCEKAIRLLLDTAKKEATRSGSPDDVKGSKYGSRRKFSIQ
jgi:hypothetical protein